MLFSFIFLLLFVFFFVDGIYSFFVFFFFSSRRRHTISYGDWSSDVCYSDLGVRVRARRRPCPGWPRPFPCPYRPRRDRKSVVEGKSVDLGGRCIIKKKTL